MHRLGLENHVSLMAPLSPEKVRLELLQADIYLSSSLSEGISNAVLEAMAIGLPVVSTNVGGMPEVIQTEITGLLVEPYEPDQIARAIKRFVEEPDMKDGCIKNARERIESEFGFERLVQVFDQNYQSLVS